MPRYGKTSFEVLAQKNYYMKRAENISGHKHVQKLAKLHKNCRIPILEIEGNMFPHKL